MSNPRIPNLRLGTSSWSSDDWVGTFYPPGTSPAERKGIEEKTQHWDRVIIDRDEEMRAWIPIIRGLLKRRIQVMGYFNNHYAGSAPGSIQLFGKVWNSIRD